MASTTTKAIIDRFQAVCEGANLLLKKSTEEFSFDLQPNRVVNTVYRIEDGGLFAEPASLTNNVEARVDLLAVWLARKATPDSQTERETLETDIVTLQKQIIADGPSNNYHADVESREIQRVGDVLLARVGFLVDYDMATA